MNGYIQISANGFLKPSTPSKDYFNLQLQGVSPNAYDNALNPVTTCSLENKACHPGFQTYPNLNGNLGVLEVIPVPTPELIDKMAEPLYGMLMPIPFKGSFTQHHISLCLTPTVTIRPIFPPTTAKRESPTNLSIVQFEPRSGCYQLIQLCTSLNSLEFDVRPREHNPHDHHFVETQEWVDEFKDHDADVQIKASILSMNKIAYMHRLFDRVEACTDQTVANAFLPDFLEKREEYLKSFFTNDTDSADSGSSTEDTEDSDMDHITGAELDAKIAQLKSMLPDIQAEPLVIENVGAEVVIDETPPAIQVIESPTIIPAPEKPEELAYMEADDEIYTQPPGGLDASTAFNHIVTDVLYNYVHGVRQEARLHALAEDESAATAPASEFVLVTPKETAGV